MRRWVGGPSLSALVVATAACSDGTTEGPEPERDPLVLEPVELDGAVDPLVGTGGIGLQPARPIPDRRCLSA